ncbi:MAG: hypothetical protein FH749_13715 [Firmicutes bacterium]|nr:hypothetical protein [Bacillota bacterium]
MKKLIILLLVMAFVLLIPSGARALSDAEQEWGELQVVLDFARGHELILFLPAALESQPFVETTLELAGPQAALGDTNTVGDVQVISVQAPRLIDSLGRDKTYTADLSRLNLLADQHGLDFSGFFVMRRTFGVFAYNLSAADVDGNPLAVKGVEDTEVWWEIPHGNPSVLVASMSLNLRWAWPVFLPGYLIMAWAVALLFVHRKFSIRYRRLLIAVNVLISLLAAHSMVVVGWPYVFDYLFARTGIGENWVVVIAIFLGFNLFVYSSWLDYRVATSDGVDNLLSLFFGALVLLVFSLGMLGWPLVAGVSLWLALGLYMAASVILPVFLAPVGYRLLGGRDLHNPQVIAKINFWGSQLGVDIGAKLIVSLGNGRLAAAFWRPFKAPALVVNDFFVNSMTAEEQDFALAQRLAWIKTGYGLHVKGLIVSSCLIVLGIALPYFIPVSTAYSALSGMIGAALLWLFVYAPQLRRQEAAAAGMARKLTGIVKVSGALASGLEVEQLGEGEGNNGL